MDDGTRPSWPRHDRVAKLSVSKELLARMAQQDTTGNTYCYLSCCWRGINAYMYAIAEQWKSDLKDEATFAFLRENFLELWPTLSVELKPQLDLVSRFENSNLAAFSDVRRKPLFL